MTAERRRVLAIVLATGLLSTLLSCEPCERPTFRRVMAGRAADFALVEQFAAPLDVSKLTGVTGEGVYRFERVTTSGD